MHMEHFRFYRSYCSRFHCKRWSILVKKSPKKPEASMAGDGLLTGRLGVHSMDDEVCPGLPRGGGCVKACQQGTGRIPW